MQEKRIVIVGGGVAGITAALQLEKLTLQAVKIILISDKPHFEYHSALYRLVTGNSPLEVCIPLRDIFLNKNIEVIEDRIIGFKKESKLIAGTSGSVYHYDFLLLGLGSETNYFNIPGLSEFSYGMKSITEAIRLKRHIADTLRTCKVDIENKSEQVCGANFVVIGAGATGVELSGQLIAYARSCARENMLDPSLVSVELVEGASKILPALPREFTDPIEAHLRRIGVNIFLNRIVEREEIEGVYLKDMSMKSRTVVWTAGVRANNLYEQWGLPVNKQGKVFVDEHLRLKDESNIFIIGDGAATQFSGLAQSAIYDGKHVAGVISQMIHNVLKFAPYKPPTPINAIPAGPEWAGVLWGPVRIYGRLGWWLRRLADFRQFLEILPPLKALKIWREGERICDTCAICSLEVIHHHE